jgi:hypothetical protein
MGASRVDLAGRGSQCAREKTRRRTRAPRNDAGYAARIEHRREEYDSRPATRAARIR